MFEFYGFMDALCAVKKYFVFILIAALLFGGAGFCLAEMKNAAISDENHEPVAGHNVAVSEYYYVSGVMNSSSQKTKVEYDRSIALMASAMLNADYTRQSVFDTVIEEFEIEDLVSAKAEVKNKYADKIITNDLVGEYVTVSVLADSSILRIVVNTESDQISERLLALYKEKFVSSMEQINESGIECSYKVVADTKIGTANDSSHAPVSGGVSVKKYTVIFAVLGGAVAVCAVFALTLFVPVINRRSDVEGYKTPVISDKKEKLEFVLDSIDNRCTEKGEAVAFVICNGRTDIKRGKEYYARLNAKSAELGFDAKLCECVDIADKYDEYLKAKACGVAVIAVSYSNTKHKEYQKTLARLNENNIKVIGAVAV